MLDAAGFFAFCLLTGLLVSCVLRYGAKPTFLWLVSATANVTDRVVYGPQKSQKVTKPDSSVDAGWHSNHALENAVRRSEVQAQNAKNEMERALGISPIVSNRGDSNLQKLAAASAIEMKEVRRKAQFEQATRQFRGAGSVKGNSYTFHGGLYNGCACDLSVLPKNIVVGVETYERIDDPDTGHPLGGYAHSQPEPFKREETKK